MHIVIFAGGKLRPGPKVQAVLQTADLIIAADSGAATALDYGHIPAVILGDFDSLPEHLIEELQQQGSQLIRASVHKDETDTELALIEARQRGASTITILGAFGGSRIEHSLANVFLLTGFHDIPVQIIDGPSTCWLLSGPASSSISGQSGDFVSLFPMTMEVTAITTANLAYALKGENLRFGTPRGISNELLESQATVTIDQGQLLIIHTSREQE
ncbi:thiamine pyrophosphokinase [Dictyobacter alpinus]|uniref:Thiamine diphosphokinase n=1 Tax=Dictyobacter alpinus TaxID=2014873 RepID=A0A402BH25_9CHLR|nr:thiamine diphosphokinase [Dictyobacter alpinus]GCE30542.1 thiamine pyrophosphokinase [Dictyobacter alpinus]